MWFIIGFILIIAIPGCIYAVIALMEVPGLAEQRFGPRKGLPSTLNEWTTDIDSEPARLARENPESISAIADAISADPALREKLKSALRETRLWRDPSASPFSPGGLFRRSTLTLQVRFRDPATDEVLLTLPDQLINLKKYNPASSA